MGENKQNKNGKTVLVVGAGLVGAHYTKRMLSKGFDVVATVRSLEQEQADFEKRTFKDIVPDKEEQEFAGANSVQYKVNDNTVTLTSLDLFKDNLEGVLNSLEGIELDHIINTINLGTLLGLQELHGSNRPPTAVFDFCLNYHNVLDNYARKTGHPVTHLLVSTTGTGGIGAERLRISHNIAGSGIPPSIILKRKNAREILSAFEDFRRSNQGTVIYKTVVPGCAIIDLEIYEGPVRAYGDYKESTEGEFLLTYSPKVTINGKVISEVKELGELKALYGLFGEDGPHTVADMQQLQLFMGVTTATKIAQIIDDTINDKGVYNYNTILGGSDVPEMSEYAVFSFEQKVRNTKKEQYYSVTLSPIAPFDLTLRCFGYELLERAGFEYLDDFKSSPTDDKSIKTLTEKVINVLENNEELLIASTSLGVEYNLHGEQKYQAEGNIKRGVLKNNTLKDCIETANEFRELGNSSPKLDDFLTAYETTEGVRTEDIIGYLAGFKESRKMQKEGHF